MTRIHIGLLVVDDSVVAKLAERHSVARQEFVDLIQWSAQVEAAHEIHEEHGDRWIVLVRNHAGDALFAALLPIPAWEGASADTWVVKTAYWL